MYWGRFRKFSVDTKIYDSWKKYQVTRWFSRRRRSLWQLEKWQRYVHKCKEVAWERWVHEYLADLRHNLSHKEKPVKININDTAKETRRVVESRRLELWVKINQNMYRSDKSEYVPRRVLLKDQLSCCVQWSYTLTQGQLPAILKMTK